MAVSVNDLSQILAYGFAPTFQPGAALTTGVTNGTGVLLDTIGTNRVNAFLFVGTVSALTSLDVKIQVSSDNSTWVDVSPSAAFTQVTAGAQNPQIIPFQMNRALTTTSSPYIYARAVATIVGTSAYVVVAFFGGAKFDGAVVIQNQPPSAG